MRGLKKQRRIQIIIIAAVLLAGASVLIGYGLRDGINFFRTPTEVAETAPPSDEVFRIGGLVEAGSLQQGQDNRIDFKVTDGNAVVPVSYQGILPDLFAENQGMVGTGKYINGTFEASEILAKHDETYMPREVVDALKEQGVYQEPEG